MHPFADKFVPTDSNAHGANVYSKSGVYVASFGELGVVMLAASFCSLQHDGLIRMEVKQEKELGPMKSAKVRIWPDGDGQIDGELERRAL